MGIAGILIGNREPHGEASALARSGSWIEVGWSNRMDRRRNACDLVASRVVSPVRIPSGTDRAGIEDRSQLANRRLRDRIVLDDSRRVGIDPRWAMARFFVASPASLFSRVLSAIYLASGRRSVVGDRYRSPDTAIDLAWISSMDWSVGLVGDPWRDGHHWDASLSTTCSSGDWSDRLLRDVVGIVVLAFLADPNGDRESLASDVSIVYCQDGVSACALGILFRALSNVGTRDPPLSASNRITAGTATMAALSVFRHIDATRQTVRWLGIESCRTKNRTAMVAIAIRRMDSGVGDRPVLHLVPLFRVARILGGGRDRLYPACFLDAGAVFGAVMLRTLQSVHSTQTAKDLKDAKDVRDVRMLVRFLVILETTSNCDLGFRNRSKVRHRARLFNHSVDCFECRRLRSKPASQHDESPTLAMALRMA